MEIFEYSYSKREKTNHIEKINFNICYPFKRSPYLQANYKINNLEQVLIRSCTFSLLNRSNFAEINDGNLGRYGMMGYFILIINILGESLYSHFFLLTKTKCLGRNDTNYYLIEYDCQEELCKIIDSPLGK